MPGGGVSPLPSPTPTPGSAGACASASAHEDALDSALAEIAESDVLEKMSLLNIGGACALQRLMQAGR